MDAIRIETATNNSPVIVAAAPPQISANVSQDFKWLPRLHVQDHDSVRAWPRPVMYRRWRLMSW